MQPLQVYFELGMRKGERVGGGGRMRLVSVSIEYHITRGIITYHISH